MAKYRVKGDSEVFGNATGSVFEMDLSPDQERYYIEGGHLETVPGNTKPTENPAPPTPAAEAQAKADAERAAQQAAGGNA